MIQRERAVLKDLKLEELLEEKGYIIIKDIVPPADVSQLKNICDALNADQKEPMWNSLYNLPYGVGMDASKKIEDILLPLLKPLFQSMKILAYTFMVKNHGAGTVSELHRDISSFNEDTHENRSLWIPLVDIDETTGPLMFIPGSHKIFDFCRPRFIDWPDKELMDQLTPFVDVVHVKAGDLVIFIDRTIHGSQINKGTKNRPVIQTGITHPDAELNYYHLNKDKNFVEVYSVDVDFYFEEDYQTGIRNRKKIKEFPYTPPKFSLTEVEDRLRKLGIV